MNEYLTKADLTAAINKHELDAAKTQKDITEKEQKMRHEQSNTFQKIICHMDERIEKTYDKVDGNDKELALLKQSHINMTEKVQEIKKEMKEGFNGIEHKMEAFLTTIEKGYTTKTEHKNNTDRIKNLEKGIWGIISVVLVGIIGAILKLILI